MDVNTCNNIQIIQNIAHGCESLIVCEPLRDRVNQTDIKRYINVHFMHSFLHDNMHDNENKVIRKRTHLPRQNHPIGIQETSKESQK